MDSENEIKALKTYYETANSEYDRIHAFFDQIDNKIGFLIAIIIGVPIATIGFASQLEKGDIGIAAIILGAIGVLAFIGAGWHMIRAISVRGVKLGISYEEFNKYSREYDDNAMKEWVAIALMESSEFNYKTAMKKAKHLQAITPYMIAEVVFMLSAIIYILICKL
jgi:hypothetical protein